MRISRLYLEQAIGVDETISLPADKVHYISNVLRMRSDESLLLFNNTGFEFAARLIEVNKKTVQVKILDQIKKDRESALKIILALSLSRGQQMDYSLQKAVELGVTEIVPVSSEFSNVKLHGNRMADKMSHWRGIIISASEQCGRNRLAEITEPVGLNEWLQQEPCSSRIMLHPGSPRSLSDIKPEDDTICIMIGPEGGFSHAEVRSAEKTGYITVRLGSRILRAETAVVACISVAQQCWGDLL